MRNIANHKLNQEEFINKLKDKNSFILEKLDIIGEYKGHDKNILCKCKKCGLEFNKIASSLLRGKGSCPCCDKGNNQYRSFNTESFKEYFKTIDTHNITILGKYKNMHTNIECECSLGHRFLRKPDKLLLDRECPYCVKFSAKPLKGFNTFGDKFPWLVQYLKNSEDAYNYTWSSGKKIWFKCLVCGYEEQRTISAISNAGYFKCKVCGDSESIPNKFIRAILEYKKDILDYYEFEYKPDWVKNKYRYDAYFIYKGNKYIVECQGLQHKTNKFNNKIKINRNEKENDKNKKDLALKNGIDFYVELIAYKSDIGYLNNEFNKTILKDIFNLTEDELIEIHKLIQNSQFKQIIDMYNNGKKVMEIAKELKIADCTVTRALKRGNKLDLVNYELKNSNRIGFPVPQVIKMKAININTKKEQVYDSKKGMIKEFKKKGIIIDLKTLNVHLKSKKPYKGYMFEEIK